MLGMGVGHSPQTCSIAPAALFTRVQLRNFCIHERPSFLASRRFACGIPDTHTNDRFMSKYYRNRDSCPFKAFFHY